MQRFFLTALICLSSVAAANERQPTLLTGNAVVSDGDSHELLVVLPDIPETASLKAKLRGARVLDAEMIGHGLARVRFSPRSVNRPTARTLELRTETAEAKAKVVLDLEVLPGPAGTLRVTTDPPVLPGSVSEAQIRVRFEGSHPIPEEARGIRLQASSGTVSEAIRMPDGSFVARYTARPERKAEMVVISAADVHFPDELLGAVVLPVHETRSRSFPATPGATHMLHVGERNYGPFQPNQSEFTVRVEVDPRYPVGRLKVTPPEGETTTEEVWFLEEETMLGSLHFFPLPESAPEGSELSIHVLALDSNGQPHESGGLLLGPHEMEHLGSGVYRKLRKAPLGESAWNIQVFLDELQATAEIPLTSPLPAAPPLSRVKAVQRPVSNVLVWPLKPLISGQETRLRVVAVDEWGLPIANRELALGVRSGDGLLPPTARTNNQGIADLTMKVGGDANPIIVRIGAEGLATEQALPVHSAQPFHPAGDQEVQDLYDAWWNLAADGTVARRQAYTAPVLSEEGPAIEATPREEAPPPPPVEKPVAENGFHWRAQLLDLGRRHATIGEANSIFPKQVDYNKGLPLGIIGLDGAFSWTFQEGLMMDVRGQVSLLNQGMPAEIQGGFPSDIQVGLVHERPLGGFDVYAGVWGHRFDALVARYVSRAGGSVALPPVGVYGARVGVGVKRFVQGFTTSLELAETFSPWPVNLGIHASIALPDGDFGLPDGLHFRVDYAYNFHQMQFTLDGYTARVYEGLNALKIGVGGQF